MCLMVKLFLYIKSKMNQKQNHIVFSDFIIMFNVCIYISGVKNRDLEKFENPDS
jgi:hypothetical protein